MTKFTLYLDAVRYCRHNKISYLQIERKGELWKRHWIVPTEKKSTRTRGGK